MHPAAIVVFCVLFLIVTVGGFLSVRWRRADLHDLKLKPVNANFAVPDLFIKYFPGWFQGFGFAAIGVGALVPAAIMSIAASNLFARNIYTQYLRPQANPRSRRWSPSWRRCWSRRGRWRSHCSSPPRSAMDLRLLGGVWIIQTPPAVFLGLYTRWFHRSALLAG